MTATVTLPEEEVPTLLETDIVVCGGGTTGPIAAIAAARQGKRVALIERYGALGGNLTLGLNTKPSGALLGGLPREIWDLARDMGAAGKDYVARLKHGSVGIASPGDPELMKLLLTRLCVEAGVQILFECFVSRPFLDGGTVAGVIVESKAGRQAVRAKVTIDCSADGDVAAAAGAPFVMGDGGDAPKMQPVSVYFSMRDVDIPAVVHWAEAHPEEVPDRAIPENAADYDYGLWLTGFNRMLREFQAESGIRLQRENITLKTTNGVMYVNATRVIGVDALSPLEASAATVECYRQIEAVSGFLIERVGGFENAKIDRIAPYLGARETRHIQGGYVLTLDDVTRGAAFEDSIAADASALDLHQVSGADVEFIDYPPYEIPYRCLVPRDVEQLLVAGRCISADHAAHSRSRNMPACMATGQAAGIAAAIAVDSNRPVRMVDIDRLQAALEDLGMPLRAADLDR
ncbi:MAG: FAD-dependent oxidoreductase [Alphaproteobacteria bacterium]|jgi:hypothetical protein|nr:FAD-dependent oxidoreductase [Alphaproteobacteria bacterium]